MNNRLIITSCIFILYISGSIFGCSESAVPSITYRSDTGTGVEAGSGTGAPSDSDENLNTDGVADTETGSEASSTADGDTDTDTDGDTDTDTDTDTDADGDSDADTDTDSDADTDTDIDTDADADADGDTDGDAGDSEDEYCEPVLKAVVRDFTDAHEDFGHCCCSLATGLVEAELGPDQKPVFASSTGSVEHHTAITGAETFDQWYRTIDGVNAPFDVELVLTPVGEDRFEYHSAAYFPVDDPERENPDDHNFFFTTEIHMRFAYESGQVFNFSGDDDLWIFIDGHLAMDLGGVHSEAQGEIIMDTLAEEIGMVPGENYAMDIFHAERMPGGSNFHITTNIKCLIPVIVI